jgi:hypothetical protein
VVVLLALFVPWEDFAQDEAVDIAGLWERLRAQMPGRVADVVNNIQLLHKSAEDARKDARLWASRSEGDGGAEYDGAEDALDPGMAWQPDSTDLRNTFHDAVTSLCDGRGVAKDAPTLHALLEELGQGDASDGIEEDPDLTPNTVQHGHIIMAKRDVKTAKAAQDRMHKERMRAIEGDDDEEQAPPHPAVETGSEDGNADAVYLPQPPSTPGLPHAQLGLAPSDSFSRVGASCRC